MKMNSVVPQLEITRRGRVAVLTLNRSVQGNRLTTQLAQEIAAGLDTVRLETAIGACVITGAGDVFCLGGDYLGAGPTTEGRTAYAESLVAMDNAMSGLGKPLIAAVNGDAHAGGFALVIACDLAIAADDATFGLPEAAKGLFPFIALAIARDVLPKKLLFDIVYNARLMDASEALAHHLINEAVPRVSVLDRAVVVAEKASSYNPKILKLGRDLYYAMRGVEPDVAFEKARRALFDALEVGASAEPGNIL